MDMPSDELEAVPRFLACIEDLTRRADCERLVKIVETSTGESPKLWGSIIGFGVRHYKYASGRQGDTMKIGIASRKNALTIYGLDMLGANAHLLPMLGDYQTGKGCLYIKNLESINLETLQNMIKQVIFPDTVSTRKI